MFRHWVRNLRRRNLDSVSVRREWYPDAAAYFDPAVIHASVEPGNNPSMNMEPTVNIEPSVNIEPTVNIEQ